MHPLSWLLVGLLMGGVTAQGLWYCGDEFFMLSIHAVAPRVKEDQNAEVPYSELMLVGNRYALDQVLSVWWYPAMEQKAWRFVPGKCSDGGKYPPLSICIFDRTDAVNDAPVLHDSVTLYVTTISSSHGAIACTTVQSLFGQAQQRQARQRAPSWYSG